MTIIRAAVCVALFLLSAASMAQAQDVTLTSPDGAIEVSGNLLGYDGEFYRVDTKFGELTVDGSGVTCDGPGCPNLSNYVAEIAFSGSATMAEVLLPALIEGFSLRNGYQTSRKQHGERRFEYQMARDGRLVARFGFNVSNTDEGFADLLADQADIVLALREITPNERARALEAGMGDLTLPNRERVLGLDALVPIIASSNPIAGISLPDLAKVFSGEISNWSELGGPDAPIGLHLQVEGAGQAQTFSSKLSLLSGTELSDKIRRHSLGTTMVKTVATDPFAIGVASLSEVGPVKALPLAGACGFEVSAARRTIKTEDYPLTSPMFLYLPARRLPRVARDFLTYIRGPAAQIVIRRAGFVDQAPEQMSLAIQGQRLSNAIMAAGNEVKLTELQRMIGVLSNLERLTTSFRFEVGSSRPDAQSRNNIELLARELETGAYDGKTIMFVGFSDGEGSAIVNRDIALKRAQAVYDSVVQAADTASLARTEMAVEAFGEALPIACDDSAWGRQINRRVEIWVK